MRSGTAQETPSDRSASGQTSSTSSAQTPEISVSSSSTSESSSQPPAAAATTEATRGSVSATTSNEANMSTEATEADKANVANEADKKSDQKADKKADKEADKKATEALAAQAAAARADARAKRIAAAVERSRTEYRPEHAYTERVWYLDPNAPPDPADKSARHRTEYITTYGLSRTTPGTEPGRLIAGQALEQIRAAGGNRAASALPRELLATALRAAITSDDRNACVELAQAAKSHWRSNPGLALLSSEAFRLASKATDATVPLLASTGSGLHHPILVALSRALASSIGLLGMLALEDDTARASIDAVALAQVVQAVASSRSWAFSHPLFWNNGPSAASGVSGAAGSVAATSAADSKPKAQPTPIPDPERLLARISQIDRAGLAKALGTDRATIDAALNRISGALHARGHVESGDTEEDGVKGVREL